MLRAKNKIYIGSSPEGYINERMIEVIFEYLTTNEIYEYAKAKPRKIGDNYLLEIEANEHTKKLILKLKSMSTMKLYKRTHSWEDIYKMSDSKSLSS